MQKFFLVLLVIGGGSANAAGGQATSSPTQIPIPKDQLIQVLNTMRSLHTAMKLKGDNLLANVGKCTQHVKEVKAEFDKFDNVLYQAQVSLACPNGIVLNGISCPATTGNYSFRNQYLGAKTLMTSTVNSLQDQGDGMKKARWIFEKNSTYNQCDEKYWAEFLEIRKQIFDFNSYFSSIPAPTANLTSQQIIAEVVRPAGFSRPATSASTQ